LHSSLVIRKIKPALTKAPKIPSQADLWHFQLAYSPDIAKYLKVVLSFWGPNVKYFCLAYVDDDAISDSLQHPIKKYKT